MENISKFEIVDSPEALQQSMASEVDAPVQETAPVQDNVPPAVPQPEPTPDNQPQAPEPVQQMESTPYVDPEPAPVQETPAASPQYSDQEIEGAVFSFLSERLGRDVASLDDLTYQAEPQRVLDERVEAIAKFVEETGRKPEDWFAYQQLNPSEMDDLTAVRINMATQYPNLTQEEVGMLVQSKYKLDSDMYSDDEVRMSQLQLKIDGAEAKKGISTLRDGYAAPQAQEPAETDMEGFIDDEWINKMEREVDSLNGLEFDLGNDKSFTFSLDDSYKSELKSKNARLEQFFDPYVREDGSWDYDTLSSHRALIDNVDTIIQSAYKQGMSDGQRNVVTTAANVSASTPQTGNTGQETSPLVAGLKNIMRGQAGKMTFKI